jgi:phospholipase A-2-activating protein
VVINKYTGHEGPVNSLAFLDENTFVSGSWDATARVWALGTPKSLYTLSGHAHGVSVLAIQSAHLIITGS